jgi:hypothetical protein
LALCFKRGVCELGGRRSALSLRLRGVVAPQLIVSDAWVFENLNRFASFRGSPPNKSLHRSGGSAFSHHHWSGEA